MDFRLWNLSKIVGLGTVVLKICDYIPLLVFVDWPAYKYLLSLHSLLINCVTINLDYWLHTLQDWQHWAPPVILMYGVFTDWNKMLIIKFLTSRTWVRDAQTLKCRYMTRSVKLLRSRGVTTFHFTTSHDSFWGSSRNNKWWQTRQNKFVSTINCSDAEGGRKF